MRPQRAVVALFPVLSVIVALLWVIHDTAIARPPLLETCIKLVSQKVHKAAALSVPLIDQPFLMRVEDVFGPRWSSDISSGARSSWAMRSR
jgi:hypothetical protein